MNKLNLHIKIEDFMQLNKNCNVFCYDLNHRFISVNECLPIMFNELMGYDIKYDVLNKTPTEIYPAKGMELVIQENNRVIEAGKAIQFLNRVNFFEKKSMIYLTIKAPIYDENNKISGVFGLSQLLCIYNIEDRTPVKLTSRELDCLTLLMRGKSSKEIAINLNLSIRTVESYLNNLKIKMNCHSKSELLKYAYDLGLSTLTDTTTSEEFNLGIFLPYTR